MGARSKIFPLGLHWDFITLLSVQLSFCEPQKHNNKMLKKLHKETQLQTALSASHCYIFRAHIVEECYNLANTLVREKYHSFSKKKITHVNFLEK